MREMRVSIPELAVIGGTRGVIGVGLGLLLSRRFNMAKARTVGLTLVAVGALTAIPFSLRMLGRWRASMAESGPRSRTSDGRRHAFVD